MSKTTILVIVILSVKLPILLPILHCQNSAEMNQIPINKNFETSPNVYARIGGLAYLIIIVAGAMGEIFIRGKIIVPGDDLATTRNIAASSMLWRVGTVGDLVMHVFDLVLGVVYYMLLKRVNKTLALLS